MSFAKIRPRRGTATQWTTANPILAEGELAIEVPTEGVGTGLVKIKIGDGVKNWNDLPYAVDGSIDLENFVAQTLEGGETDKVPSVEAVKNAIDKVGMYYDPSTDSKYLMDENGEWIFIGTAGLKEFPLYVNGNQGNFIGYIGNLQGLTSSPVLPTLNIGETLKITSNCFASSAISDKYDLTRFSKLKFHHTSITANNSGNKITVFITDVKQDKMIPVTSKILAEGGNKNVVGDVELDITNLSGEYYIGFDLLNNAGGVSTEISNMYLS